MRIRKFILLWVSALLFYACSDSNTQSDPIAIIGATIDGVPLMDAVENVAKDAKIQLSFSKTLDNTSFRASCSINANGQAVSFQLSFFAANTGVEIISNEFESGEMYTLTVDNTSPIGVNGEQLASRYQVNFTIREDGLITELSPCLNASTSCLDEIKVDDSSNLLFKFYASYPVSDANIQLGAIENVVVLIHGVNRNANEYFNEMSSVLQNEGIEQTTLLIAPWFNDAENAANNEIYWNDNTWRIGADNSNSSLKVSAFTIAEKLVAEVLSTGRFPSVKNALITGHSTGALFTHLWSGILNPALYPDQNFHFGVLNSQYFYYPQDVRWETSTGMFEAPTTCSSFNRWPYGFVNTIDLVSDIGKEEFDNRFTQNKVTYILGTEDVVTTGTLNTNDCAAVLLGEHRLDRGNKMYDFMNATYPNNAHNRIYVENVGHNFKLMYASDAFRQYMNESFE